ncbi:hypothetical protein PM082_009642 [Marasmius tenuissimus]|nr:hypothetical protein PM082_009642 [Marasmius tenuissimus]
MKVAYQQLMEKGVKETLASLELIDSGQSSQQPQDSPCTFAPLPQSSPHAPAPIHPSQQIQPQSFHALPPSDQDSEMHVPEPPSPTPSASSSRSRKTSTTTSSETFTARANKNHAGPQSSTRPDPKPLGSSSTTQPNPNTSSRASEKRPIEYMTEFLSSMSPIKQGSKAKRNKPSKPKKPSEQFRIWRGELSPDQELLHQAFFLWVRVIWGMVNKTDMPSLPTVDEHLIFSTYMQFVQQLTEIRANSKGKGLIPESMNARNAAKLPNSFLQHTTGQLARYGIVWWCPDLCLAQDSLYNQACQYIAIDTLQSGLVAGAFHFLGCASNYVQDINLITQVYQHILFHYFYEIWVKEGSHEGCLAKAAVKNPIYQDRKRRSDNRRKFMIENRYPTQYLPMCDTKATSEDKMDPVTKGRWRKRKPERSAEAEIFIRLLEEIMKRHAKASGKPWVERQPHPLQAETCFETLPMGIPLDYYSLAMWKLFTPAQHYKALLGADGKGYLS